MSQARKPVCPIGDLQGGTTLKRFLILTLLGTSCSALMLQTAPANATIVCGLPATGILNLDQITPQLDVVDCGAVGRLLDLGDITLPVPPAGKSVTMSREFVDHSDTGRLRTDLAGLVDYTYERTDERPVEFAGLPTDEQDPDGTTTPTGDWFGPDSSCAADGHAEDTEKLYSNWTFYIGDGVQPAGGTQQQTADTAIGAGNTLELASNPCGLNDSSSVPNMNYGGLTSTESDFKIVDGKSVCYAESAIDSKSTVDAGNLDNEGTDNMMAATCEWSSAHTGRDKIYQADIRVNTTNFNFTYSPTSSSCNNQFDVRSILTHEFGHVAGMNHAAHPDDFYLTMAPTMNPCRYYPRTLGKGDVLGLATLY